VTPVGPSATVATFLSFLWPGLGQLYAGARRTALIFAIPVIVVVLIVALQAFGGVQALLLQMLTPSTALTVMILVVLFGVWRLIAMGDALGTAGRNGTWKRPLPLATFAVLAAIVIGSHAWAANVAWSFYEADRDIFVGTHDPDSVPLPSFAAVAATATPGPSTAPGASAAPSASPPAKPPRINILLTGIDSAENRRHALNDTILVASLDPTTGDLAMVSFPRDLARLPTPDGKRFDDKINSLMTYAERHPGKYPDGGMAALMEEVGYLLGAPVDYYASVDLDGFRKLIDRVGGVTVNVQTALNDPGYGGWDTPGKIGFKLSTGPHTLDGEHALAFVRTRKGIGDSDFGRARRQQQLLVALQRKLVDPAMLPQLPDLLKDATKTLKTNFPPDRLGEVLDLARRIDDSSVKKYVLGPPYSKHPTNLSTYILVPDMDKFAEMSIKIFGADSRYATQPE
jgi:LCP family protein required for cell wall assembly